MRNVKLFLATGNTLKKDCDEIRLFLANKNQYLVKHGIFLEIEGWENQPDQKKLEELSQKLQNADLFTCLVYDSIDQATKTAFDKAYQSYKAKHKPKKLYVFFKSLPKAKHDDARDVDQFKKYIEDEQQIYLYYKNADQLKLFLNQNLDDDLPEMLKQAIIDTILDEEVAIKTETISSDLLDSLDDADKMLSKNLVEEALETYQDVIKQVSKITQPLIYARILMNQGNCFINQSEHEDQEKNLIKAQIKVENAISILTSIQKYQELFLTYERQSYIFFLLASIRNRKENLEKSIESSCEALKIMEHIDLKEEVCRLYRRIGNCFKTLALATSNRGFFDIAIQNYDKALEMINRENEPIEYHKVKAAAGDCYITMQIYETDKNKRIELLHTGIKLCDEGLNCVSIESDRRNYAFTLCYISIAHYYLGQLTGTIEHFKNALKFNKQGLILDKINEKTADYLTNISNRCGMLLSLFSIDSNSEYLNEASECCLDVLKLITVQSHPYRYAKIQVNLGKIQFSRATLIKDNPEGKISPLLKAIEFYHDALTLLNNDHYPIDYKNAKNLLTKAHLEFSKISSQFHNHLDIAHKINDEVLSFYIGPEKKDLLYIDAINLQKEINEAFNQGLTHA